MRCPRRRLDMRPHACRAAVVLVLLLDINHREVPLLHVYWPPHMGAMHVQCVVLTLYISLYTNSEEHM